MKDIQLKDYLPLVSRPSRYTGGEINSAKKDLSKVDVKFALAFPDTYEVGISHLGLQMLYQILNARTDIACERVYAPWPDMEELLRDKNICLSTIESGMPLKELDILGFSLQYELSYTNVLNMLDLGGIPLYAKDRGSDMPLIIGGGPCALNPEPVAAFFDAFVVGDGEEIVLEIADAIIEAKSMGSGRKDTLKLLSRIEGIYIPAFFDVSCDDLGRIKEIKPLHKGYSKVKRRIVSDLNKVPATTRPVVPLAQAIHDRLGIEIARGCTRGCRFCQAGMIHRPVRERNPEEVVRLVEESLKNTGYEELSLLSLSTGDYSCIEDLLVGLMEKLTKEKIAVSLPSMRVGTLSPRMAEEIKRVRKTGFTLAPEAGTERLRRVINKGITEQALLDSVSSIFSLGWRIIKLYFMIGLPTEEDEDIDAIVRLAEKVRKVGKKETKHPTVTVSVSNFVPKPHTPFQWEPQSKIELVRSRISFFKQTIKGRGLALKWHDPSMSVLEGLFSRGDRRLSAVILRAFEKGARFDAWGDRFSFDIWQEALTEEGISLDFYISRRRERDEILPWDHIDARIDKAFLWKEYMRSVGTTGKAGMAEETPDCKVDQCSACGVCDFDAIKNVTFYRDTAYEGRLDRSNDESGVDKVTETTIRAPRIRLSITKAGDMRFLGHLEFRTAFLRATRQAGIPLKYSSGFHPLPKVTFSPPAPVGLESLTEYVELRLDSYVEPQNVMVRLNNTLPEGLKVLESKEVSLQLPPLPVIIKGNRYVTSLKDLPVLPGLDSAKLDRLVNGFLSRDSFVIRQVRKKVVREVDIMPLINGVSLIEDMTLSFTIKNSNTIGVKPHEVVASLLDLSHRNASLIPIMKVQTIL